MNTPTFRTRITDTLFTILLMIVYPPICLATWLLRKALKGVGKARNACRRLATNIYDRKRRYLAAKSDKKVVQMWKRAGKTVA